MASDSSDKARWTHKARTGSFETCDAPEADSIANHRASIEPWLAALLQSEHLSLLIGSGLTTSAAIRTGTPPISMAADKLGCDQDDRIAAAANRTAQSMGRGEANVEDLIRAARSLIDGLAVLGVDEGDDAFLKAADSLRTTLSAALTSRMKSLLESVLATERGIRDGLLDGTTQGQAARRLLGSFLLTFASRTATRERLHVFTTNYDRLVEFGSDLVGLRVLDRFVGEMEPVFRTSRLGIDMHYNPPGIRGEPRYLEGVIRLTKLHGSIDWIHDQALGDGARIIKTALPFGAPSEHPGTPADPLDALMIYPNPAKDIETLAYPYAELFRDFSAATCQPNSVLVTYGYGFGDDHINRTIRDMLTIPSAHLAILSYDDAGGRIPKFCADVGRSDQITLLIGKHFGDLETLVEHYLPKPAIDRTTWRMVDLLNRRSPRPGGPTKDNPQPPGEPEVW